MSFVIAFGKVAAGAAALLFVLSVFAVSCLYNDACLDGGFDTYCVATDCSDEGEQICASSGATCPEGMVPENELTRCDAEAGAEQDAN